MESQSRERSQVSRDASWGGKRGGRGRDIVEIVYRKGGVLVGNGQVIERR